MEILRRDEICANVKCGKLFLKKFSYSRQKYCRPTCQTNAATQRWVARGINKHGRRSSIPAISRSASKSSRTLNVRFKVLRYSAKNRGIPVDLSLEQYDKLIQSACHWCGGKLPPTGGALDRLDSRLGYSVVNCVSCCSQCNKSKASLSPEEFLAWVKRVWEHGGLRGRS